jgi:hypothetical protein
VFGDVQFLTNRCERFFRALAEFFRRWTEFAFSRDNSDPDRFVAGVQSSFEFTDHALNLVFKEHQQLQLTEFLEKSRALSGHRDRSGFGFPVWRCRHCRMEANGDADRFRWLNEPPVADFAVGRVHRAV